MSESTPRKRSRLACTSCQSRKRKCSGGQPCSTCAQIGGECQYNARKKRLYRANRSLDERLDGWPVDLTNPRAVSDAAQTAAFHESDVTNSMANSGAAFVRKLGLRIDPARAPRLHLFAWNVGKRRTASSMSSSLPSMNASASASAPATITKIVSPEEMRRLATIYFEKVDPCYAFLDRKKVFMGITKRWESPQSLIDTEYPYDAVLCGIAAFGYLFSRRDIISHELQLIETARSILDRSVLAAETPSVDTVTGWVLRASYLRMTASPHAAWMASCTLMHLIEAAGLHLQTPDPETAGLLPASPAETQTSSDSTETQSPSDPETRRRLFGMARHLNTWTSFDLGRSRIILQGATAIAQLQTSTQTSAHLHLHTQTQGQGPATVPASASVPIQTNRTQPRADLFQLLPLSESLDPTNTPDLLTALKQVLSLTYTEPSLILVQSNLMLCIYRRIRAQSTSPSPSPSNPQSQSNTHANTNSTIPPNLLTRILNLASRSLRAAREMVAQTCPWHQVANVPFQVVCSLLAIDNRASLALLGDAMRTLREVMGAYDTASMREAYSTAYLLVALHQRRKEDDTRALAEVLRVNAPAVGWVGIDDGIEEGIEHEYEHEHGQEQQQEQENEGGDGDEYENGNGNEQQSLQTQDSDQSRNQVLDGSVAPVSDAEFSWLGDLMIDMPSLQNFDLEQFLLTDVPWPIPEMGI
ncbi:uncharacterized protein N7511_000332 [Penicillium nucicola]|uniref:uncharacterized protein n=1 Tax=Penicillium nucicola TaxID=1850975 RepID=UPI0025453074|nr:uncharacterized protein N7511_000332 [Penicillium nucicola]KAJ5775321.1 hypothetical protein N7511_000332 [Penicillium nucicola]